MDAVANTTTRYYYDDQRVLLETAVAGTETDIRYFVWGNYIDELLVIHNIAGGSIDYVFSHDHLYSPVIAYVGDFSFYRSAEGTWCERYEYDAYGAVKVYTPASGWDTASPTPQGYSNCGNPYTFTGRRLDKLDGGNLNLMYYRARTYDPETGRFMQRDPLDYINGSNMYEYVKSRSSLSIDPLGLYCGECNPPSEGKRNIYDVEIIDWRQTAGRDPELIETWVKNTEAFSLLGLATEMGLNIGAAEVWSELILKMAATGTWKIPNELLTKEILASLDALQRGVAEHRGDFYLWAKVEYKSCESCRMHWIYNLKCKTYKWKKKDGGWHFCPSINGIFGEVTDSWELKIPISMEESLQSAISACEKSAAEHPDEPTEISDEVGKMF